VKEREKHRLLEIARAAELQRQRLEEEVRAARTREEALRKQRMVLILKVLEGDLRAAEAAEGVSLQRAIRLFAAFEQMKALGGKPVEAFTRDDDRYLELLVKNQEDAGLEVHEHAWLVWYLDHQQPETTSRWLVDRYGRELQRATRDAQRWSKHITEKEIELATLEIQVRAGRAPPDAKRRQVMIEHELAEAPVKVAALDAEAGQLRWLLVVATRFREGVSRDATDAYVQDLLKQRLRGIRLLSEQETLLKRYGLQHFHEAREHLKTAYGLDIAPGVAP
jgi:hypothetical protein